MGAPLLRRLEELSRLPDGWLDGEGLSPTTLAHDMAKKFARNLVNAGLFPRLDGGFQFESDNFDVVITPLGQVVIEINKETSSDQS